MVWGNVTVVVIVAMGMIALITILAQLIRLNIQLSNISKKVKDYMDAVCQTDEDISCLDISLTPEEQKVLLSTPQEDEEKVFNEILNEMFQ